MKNQKLFLLILLFSANHFFAFSRCPQEPQIELEIPQCEPEYGQGWSFDIGGQYTWMSFSTPPTFSGSTGGVMGKLTYQKPWEFFGQARTIYNIGPLSSSLNDSSFSEWYSEFVGGYCFYVLEGLTITPYAGLGLDFIWDHRSAYDSISSIQLKYNIYYALAGFDTHYMWCDWMFGLQVDCLPTFNQYLKVSTLTGAAWTLENRVGAAARLPIAYRYARDFWLELTPYYRFFPIGSSDPLRLPERNLNQWGAFVTFRFFL